MPTSRTSDRRVAILQSCYIPWKGYFDIIGSVDVFVIYDDVQYSKNHWHNRNQIKTQHGPKWLTVPVSKAHGFHVNIEDVPVLQPFARKHWQSIAQAYAKAPHYTALAPRLEALYDEAESVWGLSELNTLFLEALAAELGMQTTFVRSRDLPTGGGRTDRLIRICQELGAGRYLSGPAAQAYLEVGKFEAAGVAVDWVDYSGYLEYPQLHGPFEHRVSILDLLFNVGSDARRYMKAPILSGKRS